MGLAGRWPNLPDPRAGELLSIGRMTPSVLDGQTAEQLDRVIDRWQRMLSGLDPRTRLYFYLLRRPVVCPAKAGVFGRSQSCQGKSQKLCSLDGRVEGN